MSAEEYLNSEFRQNLKESFIRNEQSPHCEACWHKRKHNHSSYRSGFLSRYDSEKQKLKDQIKYLEIRETNICNMACRMCEPADSSRLEREINEHPELAQYYPTNPYTKMTSDNWKSLLKVIDNVEGVRLTGGEPTLTKRYYQLLDYLIASGRNQNIRLMFYTNCSTFSPKFIEKILKFKKVTITCSLDGVGDKAEYIRYGAKWNDVRTNVLRYMQLPVSIEVHSIISAYSVLGMSSLSDFFVEMLESKRLATYEPFTAFSVMNPRPLSYYNLNVDLRVRAVKEIDISLQKLTHPVVTKFYTKELESLKTKLLTRKDCDFDSFVRMTKALDKARNQSFEEVFGYRI